ncbi:MAG TPA: hypothetical protein VG166_00855 [Caulobacteraceae bacterium]|jgi:Fic family protein|nr:hypothetical protein [Caulobacteraceae bacterium]
MALERFVTPERSAKIEPARLDAPTAEIADVIAELTAAAATLGRALHPRTAQPGGPRSLMNTYYSNLIEGHDTRPRDIERALAGELDQEEGRRNLQLEAAAHVRVQARIDRLAAEGALPPPASCDFLRWVHGAFYENAPEAMLTIKANGRQIRMTPGAWRSRPEEDVAVGRHQPSSSDRVEDFMRHFEERFRFDRMGRATRISEPRRWRISSRGSIRGRNTVHSGKRVDQRGGRPADRGLIDAAGAPRIAG